VAKFQKHGIDLPNEMFRLAGEGHMAAPRAIARSAR
jgi:hypothetical protein